MKCLKAEGNCREGEATKPRSEAKQHGRGASQNEMRPHQEVLLAHVRKSHAAAENVSRDVQLGVTAIDHIQVALNCVGQN